jgi:broad specificity phosphatase PhoE
MTAQTVMLIRHAEKPGPLGSVGVSESGVEDPNELSVRGWQRAGALARLFSGKSHGIAKPDRLIAAATSSDYVSLRSISTLIPLARLLGVPLTQQFAPGEEKALSHHVDSLEGVILIAWEHKKIPTLARFLLNKYEDIPDPWPEGRFDLIWLFIRENGKPRRFSQLPQLLLDHDTEAKA